MEINAGRAHLIVCGCSCSPHRISARKQAKYRAKGGGVIGVEQGGNRTLALWNSALAAPAGSIWKQAKRLRVAVSRLG